MALDPSKCAVLVPYKDSIEPETEKSLRQLAEAGYMVRTLRGSSQIDLARSMLASWAMDQGYEETFWIDADNTFQPEDVEAVRALGLPFVGCLYPKKGQSAFACKFLPGTKSARFGKGGGSIEVLYMGFGFVLVRREVYEKIKADLFLPDCGGGYEGLKITPYFIPEIIEDNGVPCYLSEDFSFAHRAREVGFKIMADTRIEIGHIGGKRKYGWRDMLPPEPSLESLQLEFGDGPAPEAKEPGPMASEGDLYAKIGRLQCDLDTERQSVRTFAETLAGVLDGSIDPRRVLVNLTSNTMVRVPFGESVSMPGTINGLPQCVVYKEAESTVTAAPTAEETFAPTAK